MRYTQRNFMALVFLCLLWGGVCALGLWLKKSAADFPIRAVTVEMTAEPIVSENILDKIALWREGHLLQIPLSAIHREILRFPWVKSAQLWRVWPDQLKIQIEPHEVRAQWRGEGDAFAVVTREGKLLPLGQTAIPTGLPLLEGPADRVAELWEMYEQLQGVLNGTPYKIKGLHGVADSYWEIRLDNEIAIILGKEGVHKQMQRLIYVLQQPSKRLVNRIAYIDLRYPDGFAVGWKR
jgi:cell division protein FtsQ